uniref:Uncharacterized protein n=1 Tax=Arundo donax TaxID=35708 RepID=A0A0A9ABL4_ARUDO
MLALNYKTNNLKTEERRAPIR